MRFHHILLMLSWAYYDHQITKPSEPFSGLETLSSTVIMHHSREAHLIGPEWGAHFLVA